MFESLMGIASLLINNYGFVGLFIIIIIGSSPIPIPVELVALSAVSLGAPSLITAIFTSIGSTLGGLITYFIGRGIIKFSYFQNKYKKTIIKSSRWLDKHGSLAVFIFALTPLPYDAMALTAGGVNMNLSKFIVATFIGRLIRYILIIHFGYTLLIYPLVINNVG